MASDDQVIEYQQSANTSVTLYFVTLTVILFITTHNADNLRNSPRVYSRQVNGVCRQRPVASVLINSTTVYINKNQHAFMSIRLSTDTNLLECTFDWFVALAHSDSVNVSYIDFSNAFDSKAFSKLLVKHSSLGVTGKLLAWLAAFLHYRS